jgi:hypothetical protein
VRNPEVFGFSPRAPAATVSIGEHALGNNISPNLFASIKRGCAPNFAGEPYYIDIAKAKAAGVRLYTTEEIIADLQRLAHERPDQYTPTGEQLHRAGDDPVQHRMQRLIGRRGHFGEDRAPSAPLRYTPSSTGSAGGCSGWRPNQALDQRDRAAVGLVGLETGLPEQVARDHAVHDLQHGRHLLGVCGQQRAQRDG